MELCNHTNGPTFLGAIIFNFVIMDKSILGKYRHFKGGMYEVVGVTKHSETLEEMVLYRHDGEEEMWVRPYNMFFEEIERDGKKMQRFEKID